MLVGDISDLGQGAGLEGFQRLLPPATGEDREPLVLKQPRPHYIQRLSHSEVEAPVYCILRLPMPEPPTPPTVCALAPFVDVVLPEQHDRTCDQPRRLVFEYRLDGRFLTVELVRQCLKLFQK